jgi:hypothetical protein
MRSTHKGSQLITDNLDHLLPRRQAPHNFLPYGLVMDTLDEVLHHLEIHIGFQ